MLLTRSVFICYLIIIDTGSWFENWQMYLYVLQSKGVARPDDKRQKSSLLVRNFTVLSVKIAFAECGELLSG